MKNFSRSIYLIASYGLFCTGPVAASECHPPVPPSQMTLTFDEEFKGGQLNKKVWNPYPRHVGSINGEPQAYVPNGYDMVPGGGIRLRADKTDFAGMHYTSGEITTAGSFTQAYGHFEMKAKVPAVNGAWPAFWLLPENGDWPPEIDVLEYIYYPWGHAPYKYGQSFAHFGVFWPVNSPTVTWRPPGNSPYKSNSEVYLTDNYKKVPAKASKIEGDMTQDFHVYAVDWRPHELSFSVDGVEGLCWTEGDDTRGSVPDVPMYLIANLALAKAYPDKPGWAGLIQPDQEFPIYMDIAYIKAYQFKNMPKVAEPPVVIGIPVLSSETVKPGDELTINTPIKVGAADLEYLDNRIAIAEYDGRGNYFHDAVKTNSKVAAHSTYPFVTHFTVPEDMKPGVYTIHIRILWPGGSADTNLAAEFTVAD